MSLFRKYIVLRLPNFLAFSLHQSATATTVDSAIFFLCSWSVYPIKQGDKISLLKRFKKKKYLHLQKFTIANISLYEFELTEV